MARPRLRLCTSILAFGLAAVLGTGACGEKQGALMLAISTDMQTPKDVSAVSVSISSNGVLKHSFLGGVTPQGEVLLPATLAIVEPKDKGTTVRIRVIAFQERRARVLRDVRTTVPTGGRVALLRIPLTFVNDGSTKSPPLPDGDVDFFSAFEPDCPDKANQTWIDGTCQDSFVDSNALPDFAQGLVGDSTDKGTCFDVAQCFSGASPIATTSDGAGVTLDPATCSLALHGADPARLNLAIVTPDTGECVKPGQCYIPIDRGPAGWNDANGSVQLPLFVCSLITAKKLSLAASVDTCAAKAESNPLCAVLPAVACNPPAGAPVATEVEAVTADVRTATAALIADVLTGCQMVNATFGGAAPPDPTSVKETCAAAVAAVMAKKAVGSFTVSFARPNCLIPTAPFVACEAGCSANGQCDLKATPVVCTGGSVEISCKGSCQASAGRPSVGCKGTCTGDCNGACTAPGGVACKGKCQGTCKGVAQGGTGPGLLPDGTCDGDCDGTCAQTAPSTKCTGSCNGMCTASCAGSAAAPVECDGQCDAAFDVLGCQGGKLEGGCQVDASCASACSTAAVAKTTCPASNATYSDGKSNNAPIDGLDALVRLVLGLGPSYPPAVSQLFALRATLACGMPSAEDAAQVTALVDAFSAAQAVVTALTP